jgi:hypothetical protein
MEISEDNKPQNHSGVANAMRLNDMPGPSTTKENHHMRWLE